MPSPRSRQPSSPTRGSPRSSASRHRPWGPTGRPSSWPAHAICLDCRTISRCFRRSGSSSLPRTAWPRSASSVSRCSPSFTGRWEEAGSLRMANGRWPGTTMAEARLGQRRNGVLLYAHINPGQFRSRSARTMGKSASGTENLSLLDAAGLRGPATFDYDPLPSALSRIARIVSGTLELKEVFAQVAEAASEVMPFETMGVCRLETPNVLRLYAAVGKEKDAEPGMVVPVEDFSPIMRPRPGATQRIDDASTALDPAFAMDRKILEGGSRSLLGSSLMSGRRLSGEVWFTASRPGVFTERHERAARAIADILSLSLEHERLWSLDASRRRRLDAIDSLLPAMARTLDVRGIFNQVSEIVQSVLPHDRLILTSLSPDGHDLIVEASSGEMIPEMPTQFPAHPPGESPSMPEYVLIPDTEEQPEECGARAGCRQL